jgi:small subunit ribosomal protein S20
MANTRSAEKQQRKAEKAKVRNRGGKSHLRSTLKKARTAIDSGNFDEKVLSNAASAVDKAAKRGIIKDNTADRYKSRLAAAVKRAAK